MCRIRLDKNMVDSPVFKKNILKDRFLTPFQKKVLLEVLLIPRGEVRTYAWVARRLGSSAYARAVGGALSKNPYAPGVPCHRVISGDGSIGGYSGGVKKKKELLIKEGAWPPSSSAGSLNPGKKMKVTKLAVRKAGKR